MKIARSPIGLVIWIVCLVMSLSAAAQDAKEYFKITVVDAATERGVPLVELRTTNDIRYVTDSNGIVAFDEAGLMNQ